MQRVFAGVEKMLLGKRFPMNVRTLQLVVNKFLREFINYNEDSTEFHLFLKRISEESDLAEHWIKNLVCPATSSVDTVVFKS